MTMRQIKAICEDGERSGADRLDEIYQLAIAVDDPNTMTLPATGSLAGKLDPEGQNDDRASWASTALIAFKSETGSDDEDAMSDLLCDMMHLADREGEDFTTDLRRAAGHYVAETTSDCPFVRVSRILAGSDLATVLAALRFWQRVCPSAHNPEMDIATDSGTIEPLQPAEIDELFERLNR